MPIQIQLVHAEPGRRIVLASDHDGSGCRAMALGEGSNAEEAEDRARQRLAAKPPLTIPSEPPVSTPAVTTQAVSTQGVAAPEAVPIANVKPEAKSVAVEVELAVAVAATEPKPSAKPKRQVQPELPMQTNLQPQSRVKAEPPLESAEPAMDPEDWSAELASLEIQLKRLNWGREQESTYLLRAFGHGSRSRLTRYSDLTAYLRGLEALSPGADPGSCPMPLQRADLLSQCDTLLAQLGWDAARGRELLESQFARSSRQQLSDNQLLEFNMLLESELLKAS